MGWLLVERANGGKLVGDFETREEAETHRAKLIAEDPAYEDILSILNERRAVSRYPLTEAPEPSADDAIGDKD